MPVSIGPIRNEAGNPAVWSRKLRAVDEATSATHNRTVLTDIT
jgi:hypothetical protein